MPIGQVAQSKAQELLQMLASFQPQTPESCPQIAITACELSALLDDEIFIFLDDNLDEYDYCTGHSYHHGWGQTLLEEQVIFSSHEGWY